MMFCFNKYNYFCLTLLFYSSPKLPKLWFCIPMFGTPLHTSFQRFQFICFLTSLIFYSRVSCDSFVFYSTVPNRPSIYAVHLSWCTRVLISYHKLVTTRVRLTVGNRPVYCGNRPYRPGPVTVPAGYQPLGLGNFEFEFQKLKIVEKIPKNTSWFIGSNGVKFVANLVHLV
jgi:hypothetical protein